MQRARPESRSGVQQRQQRATRGDAGVPGAAAGGSRGGHSALHHAGAAELHGPARGLPHTRQDKGLSDDDLALLGTLGSVLLSLDTLHLTECSASAAGPNGVQRLAAGLGAGALPAMTYLGLSMHVSDAGASALAAALGRGAMPQLKKHALPNCGLSDTGLITLVPALWARPGLVFLNFARNQIGDRSLAALVAPPPPPPADARTPPIGVLSSLTTLNLDSTDVGCAALAAALNRDGLSALDLETLRIVGIPASLEYKQMLKFCLEEACYVSEGRRR